MECFLKSMSFTLVIVLCSTLTITSSGRDMEELHIKWLTELRYQELVARRKAKELEVIRVAESKLSSLNWEEYLSHIGYVESRNTYNIVNQFGYMGKYQIGHRYIERYGGVKEEFLTNPAMQEMVMRNYTIANYNILKRIGALKYIGRNVNGVHITLHVLLAGSHLSGARNMKKFLEGDTNFVDGNGTSIIKYIS